MMTQTDGVTDGYPDGVTDRRVIRLEGSMNYFGDNAKLIHSCVRVNELFLRRRKTNPLLVKMIFDCL